MGETAKTPPPPSALVFIVLICTLIASAILIGMDKGPNYMLSSKVEPPTRAHIFRDRGNNWRYILYRDDHRTDEFLLNCTSSSPEPVFTSFNEAMKARNKLEQLG